MRRQRTLAEGVSCSGIGLHGGRPVELRIEPAPPDTGVVFECPGGERVPAHIGNVATARRATGLAARGARVGTVEHLLAAFYGLGVDNARVRLDGDEVPAMDGSAAAFVYLVRSVGVVEQPAAVRALRLRRALEVRDGDRWLRALPARRLQVEVEIDFAHPAVGRQTIACDVDDPVRFERELAGARTFAFAHEVEALRAAGLAQGGTLSNALVLDERGFVDSEGLRFADEPVRHKALDLLGDLALLGMRLEARVIAHRSGHALHHRLVRALLTQVQGRRRWAPRWGSRAAAPPAA